MWSRESCACSLCVIFAQKVSYFTFYIRGSAIHSPSPYPQPCIFGSLHSRTLHKLCMNFDDFTSTRFCVLLFFFRCSLPPLFGDVFSFCLCLSEQKKCTGIFSWHFSRFPFCSSIRCGVLCRARHEFQTKIADETCIDAILIGLNLFCQQLIWKLNYAVLNQFAYLKLGIRHENSRPCFWCYNVSSYCSCLPYAWHYARIRSVDKYRPCLHQTA